MKRVPYTLFAIALVITAVLTTAVVTAVAGVSYAQPAKPLALVGGKIYTAPGAKPIDKGTVLIENGKITKVGSSARVKPPRDSTVLDCSGLVVMAGFQNSHVHFELTKWPDAAHMPAAQARQALEEMLTRYGVTTAVNVGSALRNTVALRQRIESGEIDGPRILTSGGPLYPEGGIPYYLKQSLPPEILSLLAQPSRPTEALTYTRQNFENGADLVKLFTGSWVAPGKVLPMRLDIAAAAVGVAHREGKLAFAHPSNHAGVEVALRAHVDVLAHAVEDLRGWDKSYLDRMKVANMALIPTLYLFHEDDDLAGILQEVGDYSRMGGQILFGTDIGYIKHYDPSDEYLLMQRAGLSFPQILASLTTAPAERFGESRSRGKIAPGMDADLVVLSADPASDIQSLARVRYTIRHGKTIYSGQPAAKAEVPAK